MKKRTLLALAMIASTQAQAADPIDKQVTASANKPSGGSQPGTYPYMANRMFQTAAP
jgi:hypothetical protein